MLEHMKIPSSDVRAATISDCPGSSVTDSANEISTGYGRLHKELLTEFIQRFSMRK